MKTCFDVLRNPQPASSWLAGVVLLLCIGAFAQLRHDPLTSIEVDQMRDSAPDPGRRIDLLLGFARARLLGAEKLRVNANSGQHDIAKAEELLGDFALLIDELDDNLEMYSKRGEDLRTPLRHVLDAEAGFQTELKDLANQVVPAQTRGPAAVGLTAALEDAKDSLQSSSESAGAMLAAEERKRGEVRGGKKSGSSH